MFTSLASYFSSIVLDSTESSRRSKGTNLIYRDELMKKTPPKKIKKKKGDDCLASKEESEKKRLERRGCAGGAVEEKGVVRVKVRMTKQEASRLMSKCKEGGVLEFKDVAHELAQLPVDRVRVVSPVGGYGGVLHTIPEDS
ncbi:hypothetical protein D5086_000812 [Populus alba]|uniref:Uncharacterized protein n=2 Tax=Populus TaxID=3689 RepID=A0ACC4CY42_POPAL|nr:uncharacterized protein LOC118033791 [Populus alba]KAJ7010485.1 hypothetical protein NC653_001050 [Populus alba x Populus x berolinensis]